MAKSSGSNGILRIFRYLEAKPTDWETAPLSEEISLLWKYNGAFEQVLQDQMTALEDSLAALAQSPDSCLALVLTDIGIAKTGGFREWCFYCRDYQAFMTGLNQALSGRPVYPLEISHSHDPGWKYWHSFVDMVG